jgi:hypothetical protein
MAGRLARQLEQALNLYRTLSMRDDPHDDDAEDGDGDPAEH